MLISQAFWNHQYLSSGLGSYSGIGTQQKQQNKRKLIRVVKKRKNVNNDNDEAKVQIANENKQHEATALEELHEIAETNRGKAFLSYKTVTVTDGRMHGKGLISFRAISSVIAKNGTLIWRMYYRPSPFYI
jgi:hypothetical protein